MSSQEMQSEHAPDLSALVDGEATASELKVLSKAWGQDESLRRDWHLYQLIGDTLRSDELAQDVAHDRQFLTRLSARLALEPVALAPRPPGVAATEGRVRARSNRWATPMTVAAGFLMVAGALLVVQNNGVWEPDGGARQLVQANASTKAEPGQSTGSEATAVAAVGLASPELASTSGADRSRTDAVRGSTASVYVSNGPMVHDARLERYLQAHKEFGSGAALGLSAGYLRNASFDAPRP